MILLRFLFLQLIFHDTVCLFLLYFFVFGAILYHFCVNFQSNIDSSPTSRSSLDLPDVSYPFCTMSSFIPLEFLFLISFTLVVLNGKRCTFIPSSYSSYGHYGSMRKRDRKHAEKGSTSCKVDKNQFYFHPVDPPINHINPQS